jgi:hypothetical protein
MRPRPARLPLLLLAGALLLALPASASAAPVVILRPAAGKPGTTFSLQGSGFPRGRRAHVGVAGAAARRPRASDSGRFKLTLKAPSRIGGVRIVTRARHTRVLNRFQVTPSVLSGGVLEAATTGGHRVRVTPARMLPGATVSVHGTGFGRGRAVRVSVYGRKTTQRSGPDGVFDASLVLPRQIAVGYSKLAVDARGARIVFRLYRGSTATAPAPAPSQPAPATPVPVAVPEPSAAPAPAPSGSVTAPANKNRPRVTGSTRTTGRLTSDTGNWSGTTPLAFAYQWLACDTDGSGCDPISGATSNALDLSAALAGRTIRVEVRASNSAGSATARSNETLPVGDPPANTSEPTFTGAPPPRVDQQIDVTYPGGWTGIPAPTLAYRWRADCITGSCDVVATGLSFTPGSTLEGQDLWFEVAATNAAGSNTIGYPLGTVEPVGP